MRVYHRYQMRCLLFSVDKTLKLKSSKNKFLKEVLNLNFFNKMASRFFISKQLRPFLIRSKSVKLLYCHKCDYSDETQKGEDSKKYSERKRKSEKRFSEIFESSNSDFNFEVKPQPYRKAAATYNPQKFQTLLQTLIAQVTKFLKFIFN